MPCARDREPLSNPYDWLVLSQEDVDYRVIHVAEHYESAVIAAVPLTSAGTWLAKPRSQAT